MTTAQRIVLAVAFERLQARIAAQHQETTMNPNDHTEMYRDGYDDALNGHPISANPYSLKKSRLSYERGHKAGQRELKRRASIIIPLINRTSNIAE